VERGFRGTSKRNNKRGEELGGGTGQSFKALRCTALGGRNGENLEKGVDHQK